MIRRRCVIIEWTCFTCKISDSWVIIKYFLVKNSFLINQPNMLASIKMNNQFHTFNIWKVIIGTVTEMRNYSKEKVHFNLVKGKYYNSWAYIQNKKHSLINENRTNFQSLREIRISLKIRFYPKSEITKQKTVTLIISLLITITSN